MVDSSQRQAPRGVQCRLILHLQPACSAAAPARIGRACQQQDERRGQYRADHRLVDSAQREGLG